jgi:hypothetical protein
MVKRWILTALTTLGLAGPAPGQIVQLPPVPQPPVYQAQFCGDPVQAPPGDFCPPAAPPPVAGDDCCAPNDCMTNAFGEDGPCHGHGLAIQFGGIGLQRQGLGNRLLGFLDPGVNINGVQTFANTGILPPPGSQPILSSQDINPDMQIGVRGALVWREPEWAFEVCGFYVPDTTAVHTAVIPARIDLGFNYFPTPIGFTPGNGLWLQDDLAQLRFTTQLWDVEANFCWCTAKYFQWLLGVRYVDYRESLELLTMQTIARTGVYDPNTTAELNWQTRSQIVAAQIGFEAEKPLTEYFGFGASAKAGIGPNFAEYNHTLTRGDGFQGPAIHTNETQVSEVFELTLYLDFTLSEQWRIRAGYQGLWLVDVPLASSQVQFNLNDVAVPLNRTGSVFYHGPLLELQYVF